MGKTTNNPLLVGVSGRIGNLLIKQYKDGTVISLMPSYTKRKPTPLQKMHRDCFAVAVKYGKELRLAHIRKHGAAGREEGQDIYHKGIKEYMLAVQRIKKNEVNFEKSWADLTHKQVTAEIIKLATEIVTGEYDKKWMVKEEKVGVKQAVKKKSAAKKTVKKGVK